MSNGALETRAPKERRRGWYYRLGFPKKRALWGIIFLLPWILGFFLMFLTPMIEMIIYSFNDVGIVATGGVSKEFVKFDNFHQALLVDATFVPSVVETLFEAVLFTPLIIIFSLMCAILLNGKFRGRAVARAIFFIPIIMATGLMMERVTNLSGQMLGEGQGDNVYGAESIARLVMSIGIGKELVQYLLDAVNDIFEIASMSGIQILIFLAALQGISPALYEVAKIEGATPYETFWKVTVVMVSPMILTCTIYTLADLFMRSEIVDLVYTISFRQSHYGLGAAMSCVYILVNVIVIGAAAGLIRKVVFYYD
ncbi:MAG: sugar ABC transporter permease [Clostridia bacterium]|nr:sugar ABC transporter permease [Clostridia bacterium]